MQNKKYFPIENNHLVMRQDYNIYKKENMIRLGNTSENPETDHKVK